MKAAVRTETECGTCGQPIDGGAAECPICLGTEFRTRLRCSRCGELLDGTGCPNCQPPASPPRRSAPTPPAAPQRSPARPERVRHGRTGPSVLHPGWSWAGHLIIFVALHVLIIVGFEGLLDTPAPGLIVLLWLIAGAVVGGDLGLRRPKGLRTATAPFWMGAVGCLLGVVYVGLSMALPWLLSTAVMFFILRFVNRRVVRLLPWDAPKVRPR